MRYRREYFMLGSVTPSVRVTRDLRLRTVVDVPVSASASCIHRRFGLEPCGVTRDLAVTS
jgi:hypothetical protein